MTPKKRLNIIKYAQWVGIFFLIIIGLLVDSIIAFGYFITSLFQREE